MKIFPGIILLQIWIHTGKWRRHESSPRKIVNRHRSRESVQADEAAKRTAPENLPKSPLVGNYTARRHGSPDSGVPVFDGQGFTPAREGSYHLQGTDCGCFFASSRPSSLCAKRCRVSPGLVSFRTLRKKGMLCCGLLSFRWRRPKR